MKISRNWLQTFFEKPLPEAQVIADALTFHAFEIESVEGEILDVKVTPNRGHDALSHRGIAKEISAILNIQLSSDPINDGHRKSIMEAVTDQVSVLVEDIELAPRYIAGYIKGVKVGPSPEWLAQRPEAIGQKSINNVVDATNFVMFDIGQPLHAFDAGKLQAHEGKYAIEVRKAKEGEKMLALDEKTYSLESLMLVISDKNAGTTIGIAGMKGGALASITEATTDIILESANFNGASVRKTAKALNLRTDASSRFEQVIAPDLAGFGMRAAADLIMQLAGGELVGFADAYPTPRTPVQVVLHAGHPTKTLGIEVTPETIRDCFTRLGLPFEEKGDEFIVIAPFERLDITIPEDLIEEIARIIGYDKIPAKELPMPESAAAINQNFYWSDRVREELVAQGYSEVYTSVFADKGPKAVLNKVDSVRPALRGTLIDGLTETLKKNIQNKDLLGLKEVKIFEIGTIWSDEGEVLMIGMASEKGKATEKSLAEYISDTAAVYENHPVSGTERYQAFSRYPSITRDIALWVGGETSAEEAKEEIANAAGNPMIRIDLFDEFKKGDKVSYAFRLVFQSFEKTLTDDEINVEMENVYQAVKSRGWTVR